MRYAFLYIIVATICLLIIDLGREFGGDKRLLKYVFFLPVVIFYIFFAHDFKMRFYEFRLKKMLLQFFLYLIFLLTTFVIYALDKTYGSDFEDWNAEIYIEEVAQEEGIKSLPVGDIERAKQQCEEIGFTPNTERFGECVLELNE